MTEAELSEDLRFAERARRIEQHDTVADLLSYHQQLSAGDPDEVEEMPLTATTHGVDTRLRWLMSASAGFARGTDDNAELMLVGRAFPGTEADLPEQ